MGTREHRLDRGGARGNHGLQKRRYRGPGEHSPPGVVLGGGEHRLDRCGARGLTEHRPLK